MANVQDTICLRALVRTTLAENKQLRSNLDTIRTLTDPAKLDSGVTWYGEAQDEKYKQLVQDKEELQDEIEELKETIEEFEEKSEPVGKIMESMTNDYEDLEELYKDRGIKIKQLNEALCSRNKEIVELRKIGRSQEEIQEFDSVMEFAKRRVAENIANKKEGKVWVMHI